MANRERLVSLPPPGGADLVKALEELTAAARAGQLVGLAWAASYLGGDFEVDALGLALADPAHTVGLLRVLEHKLVDLIAPK